MKRERQRQIFRASKQTWRGIFGYILFSKEHMAFPLPCFVWTWFCHIQVDNTLRAHLQCDESANACTLGLGFAAKQLIHPALCIVCIVVSCLNSFEFKAWSQDGAFTRCIKVFARPCSEHWFLSLFWTIKCRNHSAMNMFLWTLAHFDFYSRVLLPRRISCSNNFYSIQLIDKNSRNHHPKFGLWKQSCSGWRLLNRRVMCFELSDSTIFFCSNWSFEAQERSVYSSFYCETNHLFVYEVGCYVTLVRSCMFGKSWGPSNLRSRPTTNCSKRPSPSHLSLPTWKNTACYAKVSWTCAHDAETGKGLILSPRACRY